MFMESSWQNHSQFVAKKAYEISYAVFRISPSLKKQSLADCLENQGTLLLESAVTGDCGKAKSAIAALSYFLNIAADINVLGQSNAKLILQELDALNAAIAELENEAENKEMDLSGIFSKSESFKTDKNAIVEKELVDIERSGPYIQNSYVPDNRTQRTDDNNKQNIIKSAMRQSAILDRIRQNHNCRLKEIQDILPDISERTLRYDMQTLIARGSVERVGNGGPATYYRARESAR